MENQAALKIIQSLANGNDPQTGNAFPAGSPYQHPDTVRALFCAARSLEGAQHEAVTPGASAPKPRPTPGAPENAGKPWSEAEDTALAAEFDAGTQMIDLAAAHKRSRVAIEARLAKLGKITLPANSPVLRRQAGASAQTAQH